MTRQRNRGDAGVLGGTPAAAPLKWTPVPAALDGRRYRIEDSGDRGHAYVGRDADSGVMRVPLTAAAGDRRVRQHEMAHVRWTPASGLNNLPAGVTFQTVNACEDGRIHKRLTEIGMRPDAPILDQETWSGIEGQFSQHSDPYDDARPWPPLRVAEFLAACIGTAEEDRYRRICQDYGHGWILPVVDEMHGRYFGGRRPAWKRTLEYAQELTERFTELEETVDAGLQRKLAELPDRGDGSGGRWGEMTIREMPLTVRLPRGLRTKVRRSSDTGAVPRYWHRVPIDGRVFSTRRYKPQGGTLLLDQSGSMSLSVDQVQAIMSAFPAVTIATYAGNEWRGELRIIARAGERASDADCFHPMGGNTVDGPALEWLAEQSEPRIWVSDGEVVGVGKKQLPWHFIDAARICQRGRIRRVDRLDAITPGGSPGAA